MDGRYLVDVLPAPLLMSVGAGLVIPSLMTLAMSGVARENSGFASEPVNTTQRVGGAFGIATLASVAANETGRATDPASLVAGYSAAFELAAALGGGRAHRRRRRPPPPRGDQRVAGR